jgi:hypothetical protein
VKYRVKEQNIRYNGTRYKVGSIMEFENEPPKNIVHFLDPVIEASAVETPAVETPAVETPAVVAEKTQVKQKKNGKKTK